jgi:copper transport protein
VRRILVLAAAVAAIAMLVSIPASPAGAHAELVSTEPASGDVLERAPEQVVLQFTEGVQVGDDAVEVFVSNGDQIDVSDPATSEGGAVVAVDLPSLDDGAYVVAWRVTSADSHPIHGAFTFRVGTAAAGDEEAEALMTRLVADEGGDTTVGTVYGAVRFLAFAGMVLLVGGAAFVAILWPAGRDDTRTRRLVAAGWLVFALTTVLSIGLQAAYAAAEPLSGVVDTSLIGDVLGTRAGAVWLVRLALLAVVGLAGWRLLPRPRPATNAAVPADLSAAARVDPAEDAATGGSTGESLATAAPSGPATAVGGIGPRFPILTVWRQDPTRVAVAALLGLALLATVSLAGHAGTGRLVPLALVLDVVHLAAISFWLGGLVFLVTAVVRRRPTRSTPEDGNGAGGRAVDGRQAAQVVGAFSTLAFAAVVVIVVTGVIQGWRQLGPLDAIVDTTYGRLLIAKVALVATMLVAAFFSRRWVQSRVAATEPPPTSAGQDDERQATKTLRRSVGAEVVMAGGVLAVTALLVNTVPGIDAMDTTFETEAHGTNLLVQVEVDPASTGPADIRLETQTHDGQPTAPEELTASLTLPERDLGPIPLNLEESGEGIYTAPNTDIPFPGTWHLEIDARLSEFDQDTITTELPVD